MASVYRLLPTSTDFYAELQIRSDDAEHHRHERFKAVMILIKITRGWLIRRHVAWLSYNARIIQCAFRRFLAMKARREALKNAVREKHRRYYALAATRIQVYILWFKYLSIIVLIQIQQKYRQFCYSFVGTLAWASLKAYKVLLPNVSSLVGYCDRTRRTTSG